MRSNVTSFGESIFKNNISGEAAAETGCHMVWGTCGFLKMENIRSDKGMLYYLKKKST